MNRLTCQEVEAQIELYAAGACDAPDAAAVERHLPHCPACSQALAEAHVLMGMLDADLQHADRLRRLHARLAAEDVPRARLLRFAPMLRRTAALAALALLALGLFALLPSPTLAPLSSLQVALVQLPSPPAIALSRGKEEKMAAPAPTAEMEVKRFTPSDEVPIFLPRGRTPAQLRQEILASEGTGRYRPPPFVNVALEVQNTSDQTIALWTGGPPTELALDLDGPGVVRIRGSERAKSSADSPRLVTLAPGERFTLPVHTLVEERDGVRRFLYLTEPGAYSLTLRYTTAISPAPRGSRQVRLPAYPNRDFGLVTFTSAPLRLLVQPVPPKP